MVLSQDIGSKPQRAQIAPENSNATNAQNAHVARLRILAAFGIICFHTTDGIAKTVGYAGLPIFLILGYVLQIQTKKQIGFQEFLQRRFNRLIIPWFFWSAIYLLPLFIKLLFKGAAFGNIFKPYMLFTGTAIHLWFLPFFFVFAVIGKLVADRLIGRSMAGIAVAYGLMGLLTLVACALLLPVVVEYRPLGEWAFGIPSFFFGFAIGYGILNFRNRAYFAGYILVLNIAVLVTALWLYSFGASALTLQYSIAVPAVSLCFLGKGTLDRFSKRLSQQTYGIYLIHPLVANAWEMISRKNGSIILSVGMIFIASALLTEALLRTRLKQMV
jgi:surface polysaccharide O-acyltransferase-like enzyme